MPVHVHTRGGLTVSGPSRDPALPAPASPTASTRSPPGDIKREAWSAKEEVLRTSITRTSESLRAHSKPLRPLSTGERVFLQNQQSPHPNTWDRSGVVVESTGHDQYRVKIDGSGRLTLRNRRFLRAYTPAPSSIPRPQVTAPAPTTSHAPQPVNLCPEDPTQQDEGSVPNPASPPLPGTPRDSSPDPAEPDQATASVDVPCNHHEPETPQPTGPAPTTSAAAPPTETVRTRNGHVAVS